MNHNITSTIGGQQTINLSRGGEHTQVKRDLTIPEPTIISGDKVVYAPPVNEEITKDPTIIEEVALRPATNGTEDLSCDSVPLPPQASFPKPKPSVNVTITGDFGSMVSKFTRVLDSGKLLTLVLDENADSFYIPPVSETVVLVVDTLGRSHSVLNLGMQIEDNGLIYIILVKVTKEETYDAEERITTQAEISERKSYGRSY